MFYRKKLKRKILGKNKKGGLTHFNIYSLKDSLDDGLSKEFGTVVNVMEHCTLERLGTYVSSNNFSNLKCRVNFYSVKNGTPDSILHTNDIVFAIEKYRTGWVNIDLKPFHIVIEGHDKISVTIQLIQTEFTGQGKPIFAVPVA